MFSAFDDTWAESSTHSSTISLTMASSDVAYSSAGACVRRASNGSCTLTVAATATAASVVIGDNDAPGLSVQPSAIAVSEAGGDASFALSLTSSSLAIVNVSITHAKDVSFSTSWVLFTPDAPGAVMAVTGAAVDDSVAQGNRTIEATFTIATTDFGFRSIASGSVDTLAVAVADNEVPGVSASVTSLVVSEANSAGVQYTLVLLSQPTSSVVVTPSPSSGAVQVFPVAVTFTRSSWNVPVSMSVVPVGNDVASGNMAVSIAHVMASTDAVYASVQAPVVGTSILDDDSVSVVLTPVGASTAAAAEGSSFIYSVALGSQPTSAVSIAIGAPASLSLSSSSVTFTAQNWNFPVSITVTAAQDNVAAAGGASVVSITHSPGSEDASYAALAADSASTTLLVTIEDDDTAGVIVSTQQLLLTEGGESGTYRLLLQSEPQGVVIVSISATGPHGRIVIQPSSSVVLGPGNWSVGVAVEVSSINDNLAESLASLSLVHTVVASGTQDALYAALTGLPAVAVDLTDDDVPGVALFVSADTTAITEAPGEAHSFSYLLSLTAAPAAEVTVSLSSPGIGQQLTVQPGSVTFSAANWNIPQSIVVEAIDDDYAEGADMPFVISHTTSSASPLFNQVSVANVSLSVSDDDTVGVSLPGNVPLLKTVAGPNTTAIAVVLDSRPHHPVTAHVTTSPAGLISVDNASFDVQPEQWSSGIQVTLAVVAGRVFFAFGTCFFTSLTIFYLMWWTRLNHAHPITVRIVLLACAFLRRAPLPSAIDRVRDGDAGQCRRRLPRHRCCNLCPGCRRLCPPPRR